MISKTNKNLIFKSMTTKEKHNLAKQYIKSKKFREQINEFGISDLASMCFGSSISTPIILPPVLPPANVNFPLINGQINGVNVAINPFLSNHTVAVFSPTYSTAQFGNPYPVSSTIFPISFNIQKQTTASNLSGIVLASGITFTEGAVFTTTLSISDQLTINSIFILLAPSGMFLAITSNGVVTYTNVSGLAAYDSSNTSSVWSLYILNNQVVIQRRNSNFPDVYSIIPYTPFSVLPVQWRFIQQIRLAQSAIVENTYL